jgi:hypothetical protein
MKSMINIGTDVEGIKGLLDAIMKILNTNNDQKTKRFAIKALSDGVQVNGASIMHCNLTNKEGEK